jgi:hypothetical protein
MQNLPNTTLAVPVTVQVIRFFFLATVASKKFWSSMSFQNLVRLSQIKQNSLPDYAHVNKISKKLEKNDN